MYVKQNNKCVESRDCFRKVKFVLYSIVWLFVCEVILFREIKITAIAPKVIIHMYIAIEGNCESTGSCLTTLSLYIMLIKS